MNRTHPRLAEARALLPRLRSWRRDLHRHPELGFHERRTAALVARVLTGLGLAVKTRVAKTGVVGLLRGGQRGSKTFAIRADMDALPITEVQRTPYASCRPGVMHACGHDGNTAMALGAAALLARDRARIAGQVKFIFQPCEESPPGGAQAMIRAGVLERPRVHAIIAAHVDTVLPTGTIGVRPGPCMAAADAFDLVIETAGGHGAYPHRGGDAVVVAAQVITALQQIISRQVDPVEPAVLTIGQISGGTAFNVLASQVRLRGTLRSLDPGLRRDLVNRVRRVAGGICRALGASCRLEYEPGHPALHNDPHITEAVRSAGRQVLGIARVKVLARPSMGGEDFTYFARKVPASFFRVGAGGSARQFAYPWHHPHFDFDEQALPVGAAVLAQTVLDVLGA